MVGERDRRPSFDIFVVCSTLNVGGGWWRGSKYLLGPVVISSFVVQVYSKMSDAG